VILYVVVALRPDLGAFGTMMRGIRSIREVLHDTRGTSAVEYGIILSLIVIGLAGAIAGVADETTKMWNKIATQTAKANNGSV